MRQRWLLALLTLAFAAGGAPTNALANASGSLASELEQIRQQDQHLQNIGWKLISGNAQLCPVTTQSIGLQLVDVAAYRDPDQVRRALNLAGDFAVYTLAEGSAAQSSGIKPLASLTMIDGEHPGAWPVDKQAIWQRLTRAHDSIEASLLSDGAVSLAIANGQSYTIGGETVCASRFELGGRKKHALADGSRVIIGRKFPGFSYAEDEFAAAIAHELAHNLLGHRAWLDRNGRKRKHIRLTEREADRLMPWLLANAGYPPEAAVRFMQRWGPKHGGGLFRKRTHDGWDERAEFIGAEVAQINALLSGGKAADWSLDFRRETAPAGDGSR